MKLITRPGQGDIKQAAILAHALFAASIACRAPNTLVPGSLDFPERRVTRLQQDTVVPAMLGRCKCIRQDDNGCLQPLRSMDCKDAHRPVAAILVTLDLGIRSLDHMKETFQRRRLHPPEIQRC